MVDLVVTISLWDICIWTWAGKCDRETVQEMIQNARPPLNQAEPRGAVNINIVNQSVKELEDRESRKLNIII